MKLDLLCKKCVDLTKSLSSSTRVRQRHQPAPTPSHVERAGFLDPDTFRPRFWHRTNSQDPSTTAMLVVMIKPVCGKMVCMQHVDAVVVGSKHPHCGTLGGTLAAPGKRGCAGNLIKHVTSRRNVKSFTQLRAQIACVHRRFQRCPAIA